MNSQQILSKEEICKMFGCSMQQLNEQYTTNAKQLDEMRAKAVRSGKKVRGFNAEQLTHYTEKYQRLAV